MDRPSCDAAMNGLLRFWIWRRRDLIGLFLATVVGLGLFGLLTFVLLPRGPGRPALGVIVGMGYAESDDDTGYPVADVDVQGRRFSVSLPLGSACKVGDTIRLRRRPWLGGETFATELQPCSVDRTIAPAFHPPAPPAEPRRP